MPWLALALIVIWLATVVIARGIAHARAGGGPPLRPRDPTGSPGWWARVLGSVALVLLLLAPIAALAGVPPILEVPVVAAIGVALAIAGIVGTVVAQRAMGASWRGDVDPDARTALVTDGPFRWVRNPILTCTALTTSGIALIVPNAIAVLAVVAVLASQQVQVRLVEEPYLERVHGDAYRAYAARTGRFVPGIGRR